MSLTDSSVDGREIPPYGSKAWKKHKALRRIADANRHTNLNQTFIPRTERAPKDRNLAEKEPEKFAAMLMEKLERVKEEREKLEQVHESMRSVEADEDLETTSRVAPPSGVSMCKLPPTGLAPVVPVVPAMAGPGGAAVPPGGGPPGGRGGGGGAGGAVPLDALLTSAMVDLDGDDNAQSILEEHCSRVWDSSNGQTPSRSPGRHSPDRSFRYPHPPGPSPNVSGTSLLHQSHLSMPKSYSHHRRKATDKDITGGGAGGGGASAVAGGAAAAAAAAAGGGGALGGGVAGGPPNPAFLSTQSFDSGMGTESTGVYAAHDTERHKHVYHHYHHHHHHIPKDAKGARSQSATHADHGGDPQGRGGLHYPGTPAALRAHPDSAHGVGAAAGAPGGGGVYPHTAKDVRRSGVKKVSDSSSNLDSGVSVACDVIPSVPNLNDPTSEKVMAWMLENDKLTTSNTQYSTDGSDKGSSQKRSSHKSFSASSQHKSSSSGSKSKQPLQYANASRSGSLDRGSAYPLPGPGASMSHSFTMGMPGVGGLGGVSGLGSSASGLGSVTALGNPGNLTFCSGLSLGMGSGVQPSQPISQDPSMPLLNPPNPTTQLEEAKRRLEDESNKAARMLKSKSFSVASSKDRRSMPPPCQPVPPRSLPASHSRNIPSQNAPLDLSSSEDHSSYGSHKSESKKSFNKRTSSLPTTPGQQPDSTVIGYYLGNEPIPYRTQLPFRHVTLAQFKALMSKKGNYRYFFKTASEDFGPGVVHEEVTDDNAVLPLWEGKVIGKVEKIE